MVYFNLKGSVSRRRGILSVSFLFCFCWLFAFGGCDDDVHLTSPVEPDCALETDGCMPPRDCSGELSFNYPLNVIIREQIGKPTGPIFLEDVQGITKIEFFMPHHDVSDLGCLTNLRELRSYNIPTDDCAYAGVLQAWPNGLKEALAMLHNLETLHITGLGAFFSSVPVTGDPTKLKELNLSNNQISDTSALAAMTSLEVLNLSGNSISSIDDIALHRQLRNLDISQNEIVDISAISQLSQLDSLNIADNMITDVTPLASLTSLTSLGMKHSCREVRRFNGHTEVSCEEEVKDSTTIQGTCLKNLAPLQGLSLLTSLDASYNGLSDLSALSAMPSLANIDVSHNYLETVSALLTNTSLNNGDVVRINGNPLDCNASQTLDDLSALQLRGVAVWDSCCTFNMCLGGRCQWSDPETLCASCPAGRSGSSCEKLQECSDEALDEMKNIDYIKIEPFPLVGELYTDPIDLNGFQCATNATHASVESGDSRIQMDALCYLPRLTSAIFILAPGTNFQQLACLSGLRELTFFGYSPADLNFLQSMPNLTNLLFGNGTVSDLQNISGLTHLESLGLGGLGITDISELRDLPSLTDLYLWGNQITDFNPLLDLSLQSGSEVHIMQNPVDCTDPATKLVCDELRSHGVVVNDTK